MRDWLATEGPRWIVIFSWLAINTGIFVGTFFEYKNDITFFYLRMLVGDALCWARASAACLNFNCMLILLPVCRNLLSYIRRCCSCCPRNLSRQLNKNITYHKYIAYMICVMTIVHVMAHCFDFERLHLAHTSPNRTVRALSTLPDTLNPIKTEHTDTTKELFQTISGVSGVVITICLFVMITSSTETIRRSYFELFWYAHHLFVIFYIGLVIHGVQMIIKHQTNVATHDPEVCSLDSGDWGSLPTCPVPRFQGSPPKTWMWVLGPFILYAIERIIRLVRSFQKVVITKVVKHPSNVFELQMKKKGFNHDPGQYVFLHCPSISHLEWHPFTLTSAPDQEYFSVHIRRVGDWTEALAKACHVDEGEFQQAWKMPGIAVDGPFGTATEDFFRYEVVVLIGAGIGVTPFASVLRHIWYRYCSSKTSLQLKQVSLVWVCPSTDAFEWFQDLLLSLEQQMTEQGSHDFLQHSIYLTRGWDSNQARNIMLHDETSERDPVTGLLQKTHYGRPQWDKVLGALAEKHPGVSIGVFFCGPSQLSTQIHKVCNKLTGSNNQGTRFYYNKETF